MKDWLIAILIVWFIYVYILGGSVTGLLASARSAVSLPAGGINSLQQAVPVQPLFQQQAAPQVAPMMQQPAAHSPETAMPPVEAVQGQSDPGPIPPTPQPLPPGYGAGLQPVTADTPRSSFVGPDPSLGSYVNINGYYLYCSQITADLQYTGDAVMKEWWDRLSPEMKKIQAGVCR